MSHPHIGRIKAMPCLLCELLGMGQDSKTDAHHIRTGQGGAQRAGDYLTIPLCHESCHQGPHGIHGDRSLLKLAKVTELDLLDMTLAKLEGANVPRGTVRRAKRTERAPSPPSSKIVKHPGRIYR